MNPIETSFFVVIGIFAFFCIFYQDRRYKKLRYLFLNLYEPPSVDLEQIRAISPRQKQFIKKITPSVIFGKKYYPCAVKIEDGRELLCVYFIDANEHANTKGKIQQGVHHRIPVEQVVDIFDSPYKLPQPLADELYQQGETTMGAYFFTVEFSNGAQLSYSTGGMVDFIDTPKGLKSSDAVKVIPHKMLSNNQSSGKDYYWCIYRE
jgi:hypothetical protein